ncbi:MAG TPA: hypothetical protein PKV56_09325 [Burkholderiaceae bacterium]|nr:hypothetical protein [Burkholderiaceae bacterium]
MNLDDALAALGANRVIWIDDKFNKSSTQLTDLLLGSPEIAKQCGNAAVIDLVEKAAFDETGSRESLQQLIHDMPPTERDKLAQGFFNSETDAKEMAAEELRDSVVESVCKLLSIKLEDRWTFEAALAKVEAVCKANDEKVSYIIDLNQAGGDEKQGLAILKVLHQYNSKGTAFLLTHSATTSGEAIKEAELQGDLRGNPQQANIPVCVISKARLTDATDEVDLAAALRIAIKRAGLRRSVHEVLYKLKPDVATAFDEAAKMLLEIPPEQLDEFVVERGYQEGLSELHVVERAITAHVSQKVREMFARDPGVLQSTARLRSLRAVTLKEGAATPVHEHLDGFRRLEVWESDELINKSFTPLACGDIFQTDEQESKSGTANRLFLLLGQPCDISLRGEQDRDQEHAMLIPLKKREIKAGASGDDKLKLRPLPFKIDGAHWACDFRSTSAVRLSILDLASLREDGRVRYDAEQPTDVPLLAALHGVIEHRVKAAKEVLAGMSEPSCALQLCFRSTAPFSAIHNGKLVGKETKTIDGKSVKLPQRVTWSLRRVGRIRMPYAAALLRDFLAIQGRDAFDLDFTKEVQAPAPTCAPAAAAISN